MKIEKLYPTTENIGVVATWLWENWGTKEPNNYSFWYSWVESSNFENAIPQTFVCIEGGLIVGTVSLWRCDLQSRQDIFPWLGGLYVKKEHREAGFAKTLVEYACISAHKMGYNTLYLFSELNGFFENLGWTYLEDIPNEYGQMVKLYKKEIIWDEQ
jgi:N-acetylglutamate synthase-like GNAT family acetyltransferase